MEIPKSLDTVWKNVSKDKTISKQDYDLLIKTAAPNGKDSEFEKDEVEFLGNLKSELEKSGSAKGTIPVVGLSFDKPVAPKTITMADIKDVPDTLKQAWNNAIEDGNINQDEYKSLLQIASPNWNDEELDPKEKEFLGNLQSLLKNSENNLKVSKPETPKAVVKDSEPLKAQQNASVVQAQKTVEPTKIVEENPLPVAFQEVKTETDDSLKALNDVNNILDALGDDPDFAPLRGIVNQRLANSTSSKKFTADANSIISSIEPSKVSSISAAKNQLQALYDSLPAGVKANPQITNTFTHAMGTLDSQINANRNKGASSPQNNASPNINVPTTLKVEWDKVSTDGKIDSKEYEQLLKTASPTGENTEFDDEEINFLADIKEKIKANGGVYSFVESQDPPVETQKSNKTTAKPKKSVLLNWPGYTSETKGALKTAFGSKVNGNAMPILSSSEGLKIAKSFGVQNIKQLQQMVKAKQDGQFGPETFFKAKVYIANEMNKPNADTAKLTQMLNALGNDREIRTMKSSLGAKETADRSSQVQTQNTQSESDGIPDSIKSTWKQVTADGKLTKSDYQKLIDVASPNKKNQEFDNSELEFLAGIKDKFAELNTDELEVEKPKVETSATKESSGSIEDSIPSTLKSTWKQVTSDGKLTKADYQKLIDAASPNKKNEEFEDSELEFLATIKDLFAKNGVDELEVAKPQAENKPVSKPTTANTYVTSKHQTFKLNPPESLKKAWETLSSDGKITSDDYAKLITAAAPTKKNSEFENDEVEFLADLKEKLQASNNVILVSK